MTSAGQLAERRRTVAASVRRRPARSVPRATLPSGVVTDYTARLLAVTRELDGATLEALEGLGLHLDQEGVAAPVVPRGAAARVTRSLRALVAKLLGRSSLLAGLDEVLARTAAHSGRELTRQAKALGIEVVTDPDLGAITTSFRKQNVALIKSLCASHVRRVGRVLAEAGSGTRVEDIAKSLRDATGATKSRAALIARDQVLTLNAEVTQARHAAAGITAYVWRTSRDERVRPAHKALEGKRVQHAEPPVVDPRTGRRAHAGQDFQCRCTQEPVIPGFDGPRATT